MNTWADSLPCDVRVTRAVGFNLVSRRCKFAGKNSRLDDHGDHAVDPMVRLFTNTGLEGIGRCHAPEASVASLVGTDPFAHFREGAPQCLLGASTMSLWDLAGKALSRPVHALLGGRGQQRVPAYDGSVYFVDLLDRHATDWRDRFREEIDIGAARGHTAYKVKIGRGAKWMPEEEGFARDKEVVELIRCHAGRAAVIGVDANNGYDLERTKRFLADLPEAGLAFVEEMFPEDVDQCLELKAFLRERGLAAFLADGETQSSLEPFKPLMEAKAVDVFQADMNHFGIEGILQEAACAEEHGLMVAPHNWGSLIGYITILHVARAIPNFYMAENDPLDTDVLIMDGYTLADGLATVPDSPGFGLSIDEARFAAEITPTYDISA